MQHKKKLSCEPSLQAKKQSRVVESFFKDTLVEDLE